MILKRGVKNKETKFSLRFGKLIFMLGFMLMLSAGVYAQTDTTPDTSDGDPDVPFDGGISLLVAAGVAYGAKQWRNGRKQSNQEEDSVSE